MRKKIYVTEVDVAYLDPPYNSRQYCDAYHLLENIALWKKPKVFGVAKKMDRKGMKSEYCKSEKASKALEDLVKKLKCRYILFSYNNNGKKLQCRSNAKMTDDEIIRILSLRGNVQIFSMNYKGFDAGKSEFNKDNQERLFLCSVLK
ncbi:DNA adenine methylase [Fibrobacter sp. UWP2]|uniref:DNA adenine methylase n=1 Tax=Fibrobacter sp. UWP2 TaxID=1896216 RepID=UPI00093229DC|nr:DNA adenine methylase [Fibrobacter sp. UWP2]